MEGQMRRDTIIKMLGEKGNLCPEQNWQRIRSQPSGDCTGYCIASCSK